MTTSCQVAVDVGGTFTDVVAVRDGLSADAARRLQVTVRKRRAHLEVDLSGSSP